MVILFPGIKEFLRNRFIRLFFRFAFYRIGGSGMASQSFLSFLLQSFFFPRRPTFSCDVWEPVDGEPQRPGVDMAISPADSGSVMPDNFTGDNVTRPRLLE